MEFKDVYKSVTKVIEVSYNGRCYHRVSVRCEGEDILETSIKWYYGNQTEENVIHHYTDNKWYSGDIEIKEPKIELEYGIANGF